MPGTVKQFLDFTNNTNNDTGENNVASVQPIANGETVVQAVLNRPSESLRQRTEAVRSVEMDTLYLRDADRQLILSGPGKITWPGSTTAAANGIPVISDNLYILPMLTPGFAQAAPVPPVASAYGTLHLKRASDNMNSILVTSQRRSYAAGDQINITVTPGLAFTCVLDSEMTYQRTIKITAVVGVTTLSQTITALVALTPSAPDNTPLVLAVLEGGALAGDFLLTSQAQQYVSGNYDGEGHTITPANLASFFVSNPLQALAEGDTLCVNYAMVTDTASTGGRRQAIPENSNTAIPAGAYFNSRVHPENLVNALPICKVVNGSLVFGTGIEILAGDANVSLSAVSNGSAIIRNPGFEHGITLSTVRFGISDWENRADLAVNGAFRLNTTTPSTGVKQLEFNQTNVAAATGRIEQPQEIPVNPGQDIRVRIAIRQLIAPTAGAYSVVLYWGDADSTASGSTTVACQVLASTDVAYRTVAQTVAVPAAKRFLKLVTVEVAGVTLGAPGVSVLFDDLQVTVETQTDMTPAVDNTHMKPEIVDALIVEDPTTYALGQLAALLRMNKASPSSEGSVILERKDQDYSGANIPPALAHFGRLFQLGSKLLNTEAHALLPRVSADYSSVAGVDFTLMWESGRNGETTGGYTQPCVRLYSSNDGQWVLTSNAIWGGTTWTKDVAGQNATKQGLAKDGMRTFTRTADAAWTDGAWADALRITNPLETAADARTPRISAGLYNGALTDLTLISQFTFTGVAIRLYATNTAPETDVYLTFNAAWNGTNWVKDTSGKVSSRMLLVNTLGTTAGENNFIYRYQTCKTTDTFPESDWTSVGTSSTITSTGGQLQTGQVIAGAANSTVAPTSAILQAIPDFGDAIASGNERMEFRDLIEPGVYNVVDSFGLISPRGPRIVEEFMDTAAPSGWTTVTSGSGAVTFNFENLTRVKLAGGSGTAAVRTNAFVVPGAYACFNAIMRWTNVTGTSFVGLVDGGAAHDFGFEQDSATYGDEKLRIVVRTGGGLQVFDTGVDVSTKLDDWFLLRAWCAGGTGLITTSRVYWAITGKITATGVFNPGGAIVNPTAGRVFRAEALSNGIVVLDRVAVGGHSNFGL
jgi:hypothetical protein